jgi:hypothetical protein
MKIYNYHPEYKYFISQTLADPSPLDPPGVWLIPAYATTEEVPEYSEGTIPIFDGYKWKIINDNRGIWYDTQTLQPYEIQDPNEEKPNFTRIKPPEITSNQKISWDGEKWNVEDLPPPEPLTPEQKLKNAGLTIEELKSLLGL